MKDMILFPEDIDRLNAVLSQLTAKATLLLAVLINKDGRLLTHQGSLETVDIVSMAALVAGNSASTLAIANLMGEREFFTMYHQGKDKSIYIANVDENTFLAVVFDDRTNIDRVKVFTRQFDKQLKESLVFVYNKDEESIDLDLDTGFGSFAAPQQPVIPQQNAPAPNQNTDVFFVTNNQQQAQPPQYQNPVKAPVPPPARSPAPAETNEDAFYIEDPQNKALQQPGNQIPGGALDTKYLYIQNIKEIARRKKNSG